jgi:hypothetical protein
MGINKEEIPTGLGETKEKKERGISSFELTFSEELDDEG